MTEEELDLLASAYLDGEATSQEVAMVERDPDLLARVEQLRALSGQIAGPVPLPSSDVMERQLAAALAEFDAPIAATSDAVSLDDRRARKAARSGSQSESQSKSQSKVLPQWLSAAAAVVLLGGGVVWLAGQNSDDAIETASVAADESVEEAESFDASASDASSSAIAESARVEGGEAGMDGAMDDADLESDTFAAEDAMEAEQSEESTTETPEQQAELTQPTTTVGGFFPGDSIRSFAQLPEPQEALEGIAELELDLALSVCGPSVELPDGSEIVGFEQIEIAGSIAELFLLLDEQRAESIVILNQDCVQILP